MSAPHPLILLSSPPPDLLDRAPLPVTLKLFGGMVLESGESALTGQIAQRRRLAFLAILACSIRGVSRDRLVALLWPDLDAEGARHRLSDSLYVVRRTLGDGAIVAAGDDLRLDDAQLDVDVRAFERAIDAGETERAVGVYTGPFLDGFHLGGEGEFDRWVEGERGRLSARFVQALRALASAAERRGDDLAAVEWLRRLAAHDPLDAPVTLLLMAALERSGNGAAALRHARVHQTLRQQELGLGDEPTIRAAADALAIRLERAPEETSIAGAPDVDVPRATNEEPAPAAIISPPTRALRTARRMLAFSATAATMLILAVVVWRNRSAGMTTELAQQGSVGSPATGGRAAPSVAVFPFVVRGVSSIEVTGDALATLVATKLDGGVSMQSVDPSIVLARYPQAPERISHPAPADAARLARALGARYFVIGAVLGAANRLHLDAALYDASTALPIGERIGVEGDSRAFFDLVDSLSARLLVAPGGQPAPQLARLASLTTNSLPALKLYLEGEARGRAGLYTQAAELFERAAKADSTFALAYYRLAWAHGWISGFAPDTSSLVAAARYAGRLPDRIRLTLDAGLAISRGDISRGESMLRAVLERYPDDFDANVQLGDLLFHQNPLRGRSIAEALAPLERASRLDQGRSAEPLFHLIAIAGGEARTHDMDSLATQFLGLHQEGGLAISVRALLAFTRRDSSRIALVQRELMSVSTPMALRSLGVVATLTPDPAVVAPTLAALEASHPDPAERAQIVVATARLAGLRGDWRAADSLFERAMTLDPRAATLARVRFLSLPPLDPPVASLRAARGALAIQESGTSRTAEADLLDALLCLRLGDMNAALASIERSASAAHSDDGVRALWVEASARRLLRLGKPDQALAILTSARTPAPRPPMRFLRGEVLEALKRPAEALAWYVAAAEDYGGEFYVPAIARARLRLGKM